MEAPVTEPGSGGIYTEAFEAYKARRSLNQHGVLPTNMRNAEKLRKYSLDREPPPLILPKPRRPSAEHKRDVFSRSRSLTTPTSPSSGFFGEHGLRGRTSSSASSTASQDVIQEEAQTNSKVNYEDEDSVFDAENTNQSVINDVKSLINLQKETELASNEFIDTKVTTNVFNNNIGEKETITDASSSTAPVEISPITKEDIVEKEGQETSEDKQNSSEAFKELEQFKIEIDQKIVAEPKIENIEKQVDEMNFSNLQDPKATEEFDSHTSEEKSQQISSGLSSDTAKVTIERNDEEKTLVSDNKQDNESALDQAKSSSNAVTVANDSSGTVSEQPLHITKTTEIVDTQDKPALLQATSDNFVVDTSQGQESNLCGPQETDTTQSVIDDIPKQRIVEELAETTVDSQILPVQTTVDSPIPPLEMTVDSSIPPVQMTVDSSISHIETTAESPLNPVESTADSPLNPVPATVDSPISPAQATVDSSIPQVETTADSPISPVQTTVDSSISQVETTADSPLNSLPATADSPISPVELTVDSSISLVESIIDSPIRPNEMTTNSLPV